VRGAEIRCEETVTSIARTGEGVEVTTSKGRFLAGKVIVSAGAWLGDLLPELRLPMTIERQVVCWFRDGETERGNALALGSGNALVSGSGNALAPERGNALVPERMPVYIWEYDRGRMFYGFPDMGRGIKIGFHHGGRHIRPEELRQDAGEEEIVEIREIARQYLAIDPVFAGDSVCMYTNTPDEDFIIDEYPGWPQVLVVSPCSGHGFKFSSIVGKIASEWGLGRRLGEVGGAVGERAMGEKIQFDLGPFRLGRW
jgi:sarcosine oxidase